MIRILDDSGCVISVVPVDNLDIGIHRMEEAGFINVHADAADLASALKHLQRAQIRLEIYTHVDLDSLLGKTANALSASLNLQLKIFRALSTAETFSDIRNAVLIAEPLMTRASAMLERGELMSVQYAQGLSDEDVIIEALESMTKVARIIQSAREHADSTNPSAQ